MCMSAVLFDIAMVPPGAGMASNNIPPSPGASRAFGSTIRFSHDGMATDCNRLEGSRRNCAVWRKSSGRESTQRASVSSLFGADKSLEDTELSADDTELSLRTLLPIELSDVTEARRHLGRRRAGRVIFEVARGYPPEIMGNPVQSCCCCLLLALTVVAATPDDPCVVLLAKGHPTPAQSCPFDHTSRSQAPSPPLHSSPSTPANTLLMTPLTTQRWPRHHFRQTISSRLQCRPRRTRQWTGGGQSAPVSALGYTCAGNGSSANLGQGRPRPPRPRWMKVRGTARRHSGHR